MKPVFKKFRPAIFLILFLVVLGGILYGCSGSSKEKSQGGESKTSERSSGNEKPPDELAKIDKSIDGIFVVLNGPVAVKEAKENGGTEEQTGKGGSSQQQQTGSEKSGTQEGKQEQGRKEEKFEESGQNEQTKSAAGKMTGDQSQGGTQKNTAGMGQGMSDQGDTSSGAQGQEGSQQGAKPTDVWGSLEKDVRTLHISWNDFLPKAVKMNAGRDLVDTFSNALNGLSNAITSKNHMNTLVAANNLYDSVPAFYRLYEPKSVWEYKKLKYYSRDAVLNAMVGNWVDSDRSIGSMKASWAIFRTTIDRDEKETGDKLDFSISELEKVVKEKNLNLTRIKGEINLANIEEMEKLEEKKEKKEKKEEKKEK